MKRLLILLPLMLILLAGICAPTTYSGVDEVALQQAFLKAADGDYLEYPFAQTISGDTFLYADRDDSLDYDADTSVSYLYSGADTSDWENAGDTPWTVHEATGGQFHVNGTVPAGNIMDTENYACDLTSSYIADQKLYIKFKYSMNFTAGAPLAFGMTIFEADYDYGLFVDDIFFNFTEYSADTWHTINSSLWSGMTDVYGISLYVRANEVPINGYFFEVYLEYVSLVGATQYDANANDGSHYAESFSDVSDITAPAGVNNPASSVSTDGDEATFTASFLSSNDVEAWNLTTSLSGVEYYYEIDWYCNATIADFIGLYFYTDASNYYFMQDSSEPVTWEPAKGRVSALSKIGTPTAINYVYVCIRGDAGAIELYVDYLRIAEADEMGYGHDGSTTEGVTAGGGGSVSSDGDEISLIADSDGSYFDFTIDTTATAAKLDASFYSFFALTCNSGDSGDYVQVQTYDGAAYATLITNTTIGTSALRANSKAADDSIESFRVYVNPSATVRVDALLALGIANYTFASGSATTTDYMYVAGTSLVVSRTSITAIYLKSDIITTTDTVDTLTYNVMNASISSYTSLGGSYDWTFQTRILGSSLQDTLVDETRGAPEQGDMYYLRLYFSCSMILDNIQFIEDATAPSVVRSWANPTDADDSEQVTLSAVVTDTIEVYTVKMNALVYPAGFSDVDYSLTEQSSNLWKYTFTTMTAGHYTFLVTASDGANSNDNTEYAYIDFDVREADISINPITFFGQGSDFTQMQVSFEINKDCDYTIYESSDTDAETDTHTGSISAGWSNIAWDKLDTAETQVDFGIYLTNGSLTAWINGSYSLAQTTFYCEWVETSSSSEQVTVSGYITKSATYTLTDSDGTIQDTGSIDEGDFIITFDIWQTVLHSQQVVYFKLTFTNGTQSTAYEHYFDTPKPLSEYEGKAGGESPDAALDRTRIQFWALFAFVASTGAVVILIYQEYKRRN